MRIRSAKHDGNANERADVAEWDFASSVVVTVSSSSAATASALSAGVYRLSASTNMWITAATTPTAAAATAGNMYLPLGAIIDVYMPTSTLKIAAIRDSSDGYLTITPAGAA